MAEKWDDARIVALIEAEETEATGGDYDELNAQRADALDRYNQRLYGWEVEGRSQFVSNAIRDQIESIMPSVARVFLSGDEIGRFEPVGPEDEQAAEAESEVVNHCLLRGGAWQAIYSACKDALLLKNGYALVSWKTDSAVVSETYRNQSQEELALLLDDKEVSVVEQEEALDPVLGLPVFNVRVERKQALEGLDVQAVPPDEVLVSARHRSVSLRDADFVQMRRSVTIGELRAAGFDVDDDIADDDSDTQEELSRNRYRWEDDEESPDPTRRRVLFRQTWIKAALDGGKTPRLHYVCVVGKQILHREEADLIPVAAFSPIWYPHSSIGVSYYDLLSDLAEAETVIARQYFDSLYLATSPRIAVDHNRVNLDDLLVSRPGGIVRSDGPPGDTMLPLVSPDVGPTAQAGLEWIAGQREQRTGIARINQGAADPNILNRTATGAALMQSAGQARLEAACRLLAEGVKDLFLVAHAMLLKHSTKPIQLKLRNQWTAVAPREWTRRTDFAVSVALGTGAPEAQLAKLQALSQQVPGLMQLGLMGPREVYNLSAETLRIAGYRTPQKFLIEPQEGAKPPQPGPPPEVLAAQAMAQGQVQKAQIDGQHAITKAKGDSAVELAKERMRIEADRQRAIIDAAVKVMIERMKLGQQGVEHIADQNHEAALARHQSEVERESAHLDRSLQRETSHMDRMMRGRGPEQ